MDLKLSYPPIAGEPDPGVETRLVYVEEWIESLPLANPPLLLQTLHEALRGLNRSPVKPSVRLSLLELYLHPYEYLLQRQEERGPGNSGVALEKFRVDADATRRVATELATGYKIVLAQSMGRRPRWGRSKLVATAIQRASLLTSYTLLHYFDEYLPTPPDLWQELAGLYDHAEKRGIHNEPIRSKCTRVEFAQPLATVYKRILLSSLVDPYHLSHGEVWKVYSALADCAARAELTTGNNSPQGEGSFSLEAGEQYRPVARSLEASDDAADRRWLDAKPVLELLRERLARAEASTTIQHEAAASPSLLFRIVRSLSAPPKRRVSRESSIGRVHLAIGLSAIHHFLGSDGISHSQTAHSSREKELGRSSIRDSLKTPPAYSMERWALVNQGPGGISITQRTPPQNAVRVGELVGVQSPAAAAGAADWTLGVVRWLTTGAEGNHQLGIQFFNTNASPAAVEVGGDATRRLPAFLIAEGYGEEQSWQLIAPRGLFDEQVTLTVHTTIRALDVRSTTLIESTIAYDRFEVEPLG